MWGMDEIAAKLHLLRSESLTSIAYKAIEQMILAGELTGRVNENALAAKLAISRGPIREALRALEQSGVVNLVANRGVFVREFSVEDALNAYDIRACLFALAGKSLARSLNKGQISLLSGLVEQMETARENADLTSYYALNIRFHSTLVDLSGNAELASIYRRLVNKLHLFRRQSLLLGGGLSVSNREHRLILHALIAGDPDRASNRMQDHILGGKQRFLRALGKLSAKSTNRKAASED
jgi:DNA-binding GntR family transcriptional regulator